MSAPTGSSASAPRSRVARTAVEGSMWGAGVLLVVALVGILNYFGMKYYARWDWTSTNFYSLSEKTLGVLAGLDRDVRISVFLEPGTVVHEPAKELLERYAARSPRIDVRFVDPKRNLIEAQRLVDEYQLAALNVVIFESGDDRRVVEESALAEFDYSGLQMGGAPTMTAFKGEEAFTSAILALVEKTKPKVLFTTGHGERSLDEFGDEGLSRIGDLLGKENLELVGWGSLGQADVPPGTDLLVVAGPRVNFVAPELAAFGRYLDRGGRMLVLLDPELDGKGGVVRTGLEEWLASRGVEVGDDLVVDPSSTLPFYGAETIFVRAAGAHPIVKNLAQADYPVIVGLARSLRAGELPAGVTAETLLQTSADGWGERDLANLRAVAKGEGDAPGPVAVGIVVAAGAKDEAADPSLEGLDAEVSEPDAASAAADAGDAPAWRLVVFGDSDFATNAQLGNVGNPTLFANAFNWLLERENLLGIGPKKPEQARLSLSGGELAAVTWGTLLGLPALAVAAGVLVWSRRRR